MKSSFGHRFTSSTLYISFTWNVLARSSSIHVFPYWRSSTYLRPTEQHRPVNMTRRVFKTRKHHTIHIRPYTNSTFSTRQGRTIFLCTFPYSTDRSCVNYGIDMRASRQKRCLVSFVGWAIPLGGNCDFIRHLYTKLYWTTSRRFAYYFLYIHLGRTTVPDALVLETWWPHGSGKGVLDGTEGLGPMVLATRQKREGWVIRSRERKIGVTTTRQWATILGARLRRGRRNQRQGNC